MLMMGKKPVKFSDAIRKAVNDSGRSRYSICKAAEIDQSQFSKFMAGLHGLSMAKLDRLAAVLGLELRPVKRAGKRKGKV